MVRLERRWCYWLQTVVVLLYLSVAHLQFAHAGVESCFSQQPQVFQHLLLPEQSLQQTCTSTLVTELNTTERGSSFSVHSVKNDTFTPNYLQIYQTYNETEREDSHSTVPSKNSDVISPQLHNFLSSLSPLTETSTAQGDCGRHSRIVKNAISNLELWALKLFDASAKIPSGLLNGNVNQFGDYDQCVDSRNEDEEDKISGKYCLVFFDIELRDSGLPPNPRLQHVIRLLRSYDVLKSNFTDPGHRVPRYTTINWAFCMPASCSPQDLQESIENSLARHSLIPELTFKVRADPQMCSVKSEPVYDAATLFAITVFLVILGLIAVSTMIDFLPETLTDFKSVPQGKMQRLLLAFSLRKNVNQLLSTSSPADDIQSVHGIRFLNAFGLIVCHKSMALFFNPYANRTFMTERLNAPWTVVGRTAIIYTDAFMMISGLLSSYSMVQELDRKKKIDVSNRYVSRFLRITPNFVAIILFCTYIMQLMGSGPQWNLVVKHYSDICKEHMWKNFLYIHNYFGFQNMCLTHTHQLGIDMQLFVVSPLAVFVIWRWPRPGAALLALVAGLSTWLRYSVTTANQLSMVVYFGNTVKRMFDTANLSYILPTHRATVYLIGIVLGYYLRRHSDGINLSKNQRIVGWVLTTIIGMIPWFGPFHMSDKDYKYDVFEAAMYAAFSPIFWSAFVVGLVLLCQNDLGGWMGRFLRWKGFVIFTRISYAVYLTQFPLFFYNVGTTRTSSQYTILDLLNVNEFLGIMIASVILTLLIDLPFQEVKKVLTEKKGIKPAQKPTECVNEGTKISNQMNERVASG